MKNFIRTVVITAAFACIAASFVQSKNADEILKSINQFRSKSITDAWDVGEMVDMNVLNEQIAVKANEAIKGVDPTKVEAAQAYSWAQLFALAGKHKETCDLAARYLKTSPPVQQKYEWHILMLDSCTALGEGDMLADLLPDVVAPNLALSQTFLRAVLYSYAEPIAEDRGIDAAFEAIDFALDQVKFETPEKYAERMLPTSRARNRKNADGSSWTDERLTVLLVAEGKKINDRITFSAAGMKSWLLQEAGREEDAIQVLKEFVKNRDPANAYVAIAISQIRHIKALGSPATSLSFDRQYGEFKSLEAWKGKVVIIDFTAHW